MEPLADREAAELEREVHRALRDLPIVRAPLSFAPRVMQAVLAAPGWRGWRLEWQLLYLVSACSLLIAVAIAVPRAVSWVGGLATTRALLLTWQIFLEPIAMPIVSGTAVLCTACALIVAALKHVAWEGREISH
jgi:hypothetical protein